MKKNNIVGRRMLAYIIDIFIVSLLVGLIFFNHNTRVDESRSRDLMKIIDDYSNEVISTEEYLNKYIDIIYQENQDNFDENIIYFVVSVGYFLIFQFLNGGVSIGKKLMKIRIVANDKKEVKIWQLLVRVCLINEILPMMLLLIITKILTGYSFLIGYGIVSFMRSLIIIICGLTLLVSKKHIAFHDRLSNSHVIIDE